MSAYEKGQQRVTSTECCFQNATNLICDKLYFSFTTKSGLVSRQIRYDKEMTTLMVSVCLRVCE